MGKDNGIRIISLKFKNFLYAEFLMNMASTIPQKHISACYGIDVVSKVVVWTKDEFLVGWETINYLLCV